MLVLVFASLANFNQQSRGRRRFVQPQDTAAAFGLAVIAEKFALATPCAPSAK